MKPTDRIRCHLCQHSFSIAEYPQHLEAETERAAIKEFLGNMSREEAERQAVEEGRKQR